MRLLTACLLPLLLLGCPRPPAQRGPEEAGQPAVAPPSGQAAETAQPVGTAQTAQPAGTTQPAEGEVMRYRVKDNGIRCIAAPCFHYDAVNDAGVTEQVSDVDLSGAGLDEAQQQAAQEALAGKGLTVRGRIVTVPKAGPAGDGRVLKVESVEDLPPAGR